MHSTAAAHERMKPISKQVQDSRSSSQPQDQAWDDVPSTFRSAGLLPSHWEALFGPLRSGSVDDLVVVAQTGQSLDGRIATPAGHSHYINSAAGRAHLHRLRALVDVVVVGVATVVADDPQLTVRLVHGPGPAGLALPPIARIDEALRPTVRIHRVAEEVLFDCDFSACRVPVFRAKAR